MVKNLVNVSELMDTAITKSRFLKEGILKSEWNTIVGDLSKKSFVIFLKQGKLFVGVENSIWIQQMNFKKKEIITKINILLGDNYVKEIFFKIAKKNTEDYFLNEIKKDDYIDLKDIVLTEEEHLQIIEKLKEIENDFIRGKTKIILEKSYKRKKYLKLYGYKQCKCGIYYNSKSSMCAICKNKEVLELEETLIKSFKNGKLLKYSLAVNQIKGLTEKEYQRIKLKKLSKIKKDIDIHIKDKKDDLAFQLSKIYFKIDLGILDEDYLIKRAEEFLEILKK